MYIELKHERQTYDMSNFDDKLRALLADHIDSSEGSYYKVAKETGISTQVIYRFRGGGGLNGENTVRLMDYLEVNKDQLLNEQP